MPTRTACCKSYRAMYDAYARIFSRLGLAVPRGRRGHRPDRRQRFARIPGARRIRRGRDRLVSARPTTRPTSSWRRRSRSRRRVPRRAEPMQKVPTPGKSTCEDVAELLGLPLARTVEVHHARGRHRGSAGARLHAAPARRPRAERDQGHQASGPREVPMGDRCRNRRHDRLARRLPRSGRHPEGPDADRRPHGGGDGRFRLRRERARLPPARRQFRPRLPRAGPRRRPAQRRRRRPLARRQGPARDPARHRGRPRLRARRPTTPRRWVQPISTPAVNPGSWRWAATASASRASSRPRSSRITTAKGIIWPLPHRAVRRGDRAGRLRPQRGGSHARRPRCTTSWRRPVSRCCSTTAASALA